MTTSTQTPQQAQLLSAASPFSRLQLLQDQCDAYKQQVDIIKRTAEAKIAELERVRDENRQLAAALEAAKRRALDADAKLAALSGGAPEVARLSAQLDGARAAHETTETQLREAQAELATLRADIAKSEATLELLKEDRASLVAQVTDLTQHEAVLTDESAKLVDELRAARAEAAALQERVGSLSNKATVVQDVAASSRSLAQLAADKDFHQRFPGVPQSDTLVEWFSCSSGGFPGYLYISTGHICWQAMGIVAGIASKVVVPITKVTGVNKRTVARVLPVQGLLFDIVIDGEKPLSLRGARWLDILRNIHRVATLAGRPIRILSDGKDQPDLLGKPE